MTEDLLNICPFKFQNQYFAEESKLIDKNAAAFVNLSAACIKLPAFS